MNTTQNPLRVIVVGGVAGGMSAAARLRRLNESAEIIVLEKGNYVSFANCGLPYHVSGEIFDEDDLLLHTPDTLRATLNIDVRLGHEVISIDREAMTVTARTREGEIEFPYDELVVSPGATAFIPDIPGIKHSSVTHLRTVAEAIALANRADAATSAVVLGAGFIGLETAEALRERGLDVSIVELAPHVLPPLDAELATYLNKELRTKCVTVYAGQAATAIEDVEGGSAAVVLADGKRIAADLIVVSVGVRPNTEFLQACGIETTERGAVIVDHQQRTNDPHIYAAGDAVAVKHGVTGTIGPVPLAGPANRQGRRAAEAIMGVAGAVQPVLGTAIVRVFGLTAAMTGASQRQLDQAGIEHFTLQLHPNQHAGYYPGAEQIHMTVSFSPEGKLLGAQAVGREGVDKRIDVLATALRAGMGADDLAELELAYSPPYGSAKDPVNMAGFMAQNVLAGTLKLWHAEDVEEARKSALILDVRSPAEFDSGHLPEAMHVPHTQVRERLEEIRTAANGRRVMIHCASGFRSYLAHRILEQEGMDSANFSGGMLTMRAALPDLELVTSY